MDDKKPKAKTIGISQETWKELKILSTERDETLSETIRFLLDEWRKEIGGKGTNGSGENGGRKGD